MKKFLGIARKVDNLGRVVIPKSYRDELKLKEGDKVRIIMADNQIIIEKYY